MGSLRRIMMGQIDANESDDDLEFFRYRWGHSPRTLSACTETGAAELSIKVPKQRSYTGRRPVIPCSLADTPCATLGVQGVLDRLNATLGTSHTRDRLPVRLPLPLPLPLLPLLPLLLLPLLYTAIASPAPSSTASMFGLWKFLTWTLGHYLDYQDQGQHQHQLLSMLEDFIERNYDFGTAYALLRPVGNIENPSKI
ncbi:hypothetical protein ARMSODRAFT_453903 [Armillaria solidipes]|uniref:Uncharacterized protein n=1 Tax=Armillaria solidipes TaxID=1076256 RepID=A0A2H3B7M6_9AGAR|nr:hypothetical protein ARMSODRAFT_453903 [Armillaria solidipes]